MIFFSIFIKILLILCLGENMKKKLFLLLMPISIKLRLVYHAKASHGKSFHMFIEKDFVFNFNFISCRNDTKMLQGIKIVKITLKKRV